MLADRQQHTSRCIRQCMSAHTQGKQELLTAGKVSIHSVSPRACACSVAVECFEVGTTGEITMPDIRVMPCKAPSLPVARRRQRQKKSAVASGSCPVTMACRRSKAMAMSSMRFCTCKHSSTTARMVKHAPLGLAQTVASRHYGADTVACSLPHNQAHPLRCFFILMHTNLALEVMSISWVKTAIRNQA